MDFLIDLSELHPAVVGEAVSSTWASGYQCIEAVVLLLPSEVLTTKMIEVLTFLRNNERWDSA